MYYSDTMGKTLFRAKKIVTNQGDRWVLDINLMFEGREFSMTEIPITITADDVPVLCPGADTEKGKRFEDIVSISDPYQFCSIFREALTDEVPELLCDVYAGHAWTARFVDIDGREFLIQSYLTEDFMDSVSKVFEYIDRFWMEISVSDTRFRKDWSIDRSEKKVVYSNLQDGFSPLNPTKAQDILRSLIPLNIFSDSEQFRGTVMKSGNSLAIKVTDQCRRMGLDVGDDVDVVMKLNTPKDNTELRVFAAQIWEPIDDPDDICHRDGCDLSKVQSFIDDFNIIGTVNPGAFKPADPGSPYRMIFDHLNFFKVKDGSNIVVSQPYKNITKFEYAREWARINGCDVEEHMDRSWHRPGETTLYVFRKRVKHDWIIPEVKGTRSL